MEFKKLGRRLLPLLFSTKAKRPPIPTEPDGAIYLHKAFDRAGFGSQLSLVAEGIKLVVSRNNNKETYIVKDADPHSIIHQRPEGDRRLSPDEFLARFNHS